MNGYLINFEWLKGHRTDIKLDHIYRIVHQNVKWPSSISDSQRIHWPSYYYIIIHPQYEKKDGIRKEEIRGYQETDGPVNRQINCPQMVVMALFLTRAAAPV